MVILRAGTFEKIQEFKPAKSIGLKKKKQTEELDISRSKTGDSMDFQFHNRVSGFFFSFAPVSGQPRKDPIPVFSSRFFDNPGTQKL